LSARSGVNAFELYVLQAEGGVTKSPHESSVSAMFTAYVIYNELPCGKYPQL